MFVGNYALSTFIPALRCQRAAGVRVDVMEDVTRLSHTLAHTTVHDQAAVTLLEERGKLGVPPGVHTPGYVFRNSGYVSRLQAHGINFQRVHTITE